MTGGADRADGRAGIAQVLGRRETRGGKTTVYFRTSVKGGAGVQQLGEDAEGNPQLQGAQLSGNADLITAATYDSDGTMTEVSVTAAAAGESRGLVSALFGGESEGALGNSKKGAVVYEATLPVRNDTDRQVATEFLVNAGITQVGGVALQAANLPNAVVAAGRFLGAARERGYTTKQSYEKKDKKLGVDANVELGLELGANVAVESSSQTSTDAQFWDGSGWVDRTECNPA